MIEAAKAGKKVAVVGGAGLVGAAVVEVALGAGHDVVVVDRAPPRRAVHHRRVDVSTVDVADLAAAFVGVDVVVHLVARVDPPRDGREREAMRTLHRRGTEVVVDAARAAGVSRFVLVSSAVVYGARASNPVPIVEEQTPDPCDFPYAIDKWMQEQIVRARWGASDVAVVRPAIIYGPRAKSYLTEILRAARLPVVKRGILPALDGHRPPLQFVHVDDVARVVVAAAAADDAPEHDGVFNACARDWLAYDDVAKEAGLVVVDVDGRAVGAVLERLVPLLPPSLRAPRALFPYLMHPFVLSAAKTARVLGVTTGTSRDALRTLF